MASYATIPADVETNESSQPLVVNKQTSGLKRLVAGAALASFVLGLLAATAVNSASTPLTTNFNSKADAEYRAGLPDGYYPSVQLMINPTNQHDKDDGQASCLTLPMDQVRKVELGEESRVIPVMYRCYDKSANKKGQIFGIGYPDERLVFGDPGLDGLCLTTDSDSLWFEKCEDEGWEKDFTFDKEPTAPSHGTGILGQVKSSDGKCFGVDGWVKPVMTSCDSETTGETGMPVENSWYLIEGRLY